jgi:hypothetical protein
MPIELGITTAAAAAPPGGRGGGRPGATVQTQILRLDQKHQAFTIPLTSEPLGVVLDPQAWVMMQATFERN